MTVRSAGTKCNDPQRHGDLEGREDGQGDGHGGQRAPDQGAGGDAEAKANAA